MINVLYGLICAKTYKIRYILSILLSFLVFPFSYGQNVDQAVQILIDLGFENISYDDTSTERVYVLENAAYRLNGIGIAKAIDVISRNGMPDNEKACRLIFLKNNVPEISLLFNPTKEDSAQDCKVPEWEVSYDLGDDWRKVTRGKKMNSSLYKVDIVVYPELSLKNLIITQIYQVLFNLSPAIEVSLWNGMKLTAQVVFPVYNDGFGVYAGKVHPGFITVEQTVRLPYNIWSTLTLGMFNAGRYGGEVSFYHPFKDERFSVEGAIGLTSTYYWNKFELVYGTKKRLTWNVGGSFYWPRYNLQFTGKVEQYLLGERGVRVDVIRHFRYCSIGFYAMKAKDIRSNGGFRFQVALPPYRYKRRGYVPRVMPSNNMGIAYNAGNERVYYRNFRSNPSENIMYLNRFNPYFIKSALLNF